MNCFITKVDVGEDLPMIVLTIDGGELHGLGWGGEKYSKQRRISLRDVSFGDFEITHFYGLAEVHYSGLMGILIGRLTAWPYIKIHIWRRLNRIDQFFFNKKKLVTKKRMDLLRLLIERHLDGESEFRPISLMTDLYSVRWVKHPDADKAQQQLEFYLDSMVETGELARPNGNYQVTGKALKAFEEYEDQEQRHTENVKMQRLLLLLTGIIAALTAVQADLL